MRKLCVLLLCLWAFSSEASQCLGKFINPATDICWSCLFPLSLGEAKLYNSALPDTRNPKSPVCACPTLGLPKPGLSVGFWAPSQLVEVVRQPFCFPSLGGLQLQGMSLAGHGAVNNQHHSFYQVHAYRYPVLALLEILSGGSCGSEKSFEVAWMSELDPTWQDDSLTALLNPEALLFGNPAAQATCAADCVAATAHLSLSPLFWCAGCQGGIYPLNGRVEAHVSGVQASLLLTHRLLFKLHRLGLERATDATSTAQLCLNPARLLMRASTYRTQMVHPVVARIPHRGGCEPLGRSSVPWESMKDFPIKGEDFSYVVWKKINCCAA